MRLSPLDLLGKPTVRSVTQVKQTGHAYQAVRTPERSGPVPVDTMKAYANLRFGDATEEKMTGENWIQQWVSKAEGTKDWSIQLHPEQPMTMSGRLGNTTFTMFIATPPADQAGSYQLSVQQGQGEPQFFDLKADSPEFDQLEAMAFKQVEQQYGFGESLDATNILNNLARQTYDQNIVWQRVDGNGKAGMFPEVDQYLETRLADDTRIGLYEKQLSKGSQPYLAVKKPDAPLQIVLVGGDSEVAAFELLKESLELAQTQLFLEEAIIRFQQDKQELGERLAGFRSEDSA